MEKTILPLLQINGHDYSSCVKVPSWNVNTLPVYEEWTDANYVTHRDILRNRVSGKFTLVFHDEEKYYQYLDDIANGTTPEGYIILTVYSNNTNALSTGNFFLDQSIKNSIPIIGSKDFEGIEVTINER